MKASVKLSFVVAGILFGISGNMVLADKGSVPEIDSLDLGSLAQDAAKQKKQLMVVYYKDTCAPCEQLSQQGSNVDASVSQASPGFVMYKTNVRSGFKVVCPNGEQFADDEFMVIKGITELPAVVITDSFGNVMYVENSVTSKEQLLAVGKKYKKRNVVSNKGIRAGVSN